MQVGVLSPAASTCKMVADIAWFITIFSIVRITMLPDESDGLKIVAF